MAYLQNHDQIGNRATATGSPAALAAACCGCAALLLLTAPFTPMLFMGEEWAASTPWQFFTCHPEPELGAGDRRRPHAEFAATGWAPGRVPDPQDPATFHRSRLDWAELDKPEHPEMFDWYRRLIALRRELPQLTDPGRLATGDVRRGRPALHRCDAATCWSSSTPARSPSRSRWGSARSSSRRPPGSGSPARRWHCPRTPARCCADPQDVPRVLLPRAQRLLTRAAPGRQGLEVEHHDEVAHH